MTLAPLPEVNYVVVEAVNNWLYTRGEKRRPKNALVLWLVVKLYQTRTPWPSARVIADHLGVSESLVNVTLSRRRHAEGMIAVVVETKYGQREWMVTTERHIEPCDELIKVVVDAEKEWEHHHHLPA